MIYSKFDINNHNLCMYTRNSDERYLKSQLMINIKMNVMKKANYLDNVHKIEFEKYNVIKFFVFFSMFFSLKIRVIFDYRLQLKSILDYCFGSIFSSSQTQFSLRS